MMQSASLLAVALALTIVPAAAQIPLSPAYPVPTGKHQQATPKPEQPSAAATSSSRAAPATEAIAPADPSGRKDAPRTGEMENSAVVTSAPIPPPETPSAAARTKRTANAGNAEAVSRPNRRPAYRRYAYRGYASSYRIGTTWAGAWDRWSRSYPGPNPYSPNGGY